ncbi:MAG: NAD(+)/NADH kinase [Clostridia bacterium]
MRDGCIGFFTNPNKPHILEKVRAELMAMLSRGHLCTIHPNLKQYMADIDVPDFDEAHPNCIVAFGGDGTILRAASVSIEYGAPILGVNLGRVGFLSEIVIDKLDEALRNIALGRYRIEERMMLDCRINGDIKLSCLNDVLLYKKSFSGVAEISVDIDGIDAGRVFCDGLVISTPTGATGYSISAGGPVVAPGLDAAIITPVCPHTLCFRPIIVSADSTMSFIVNSGGLVAIDGIHIAEVSEKDRISVCRSAQHARFIRLEERNLYSLIKDRLA